MSDRPLKCANNAITSNKSGWLRLTIINFEIETLKKKLLKPIRFVEALSKKNAKKPCK
jgi:hypothetical protein